MRSCGRDGRARSGSCRGPCRGPGTRRARRRRGTRSRRAPRLGRCAARRRTRRVESRARSTPRSARPTISEAQLWPCTETPPRSPGPSRPTLWRRMSAPLSWLVWARSASAAAACWRSTRSISTQPRLDCTSGRACRASWATSAAVSSTSSNNTDHATLLSWCAPTIEPAGVSAKSRSAGVALRRDSCWCPHVEADSGEGRTSAGHELPRFVLAQRNLAQTPRRAMECREESSESRPFGGHRAVASVGSQRTVDRNRATLRGRCVDRQEPDPTGTRSVELHDQSRP